MIIFWIYQVNKIHYQNGFFTFELWLLPSIELHVQLTLLDGAALEEEARGEETQKRVVRHEYSEPFYLLPSYSLLFQEFRADDQNEFDIC